MSGRLQYSFRTTVHTCFIVINLKRFTANITNTTRETAQDKGKITVCGIFSKLDIFQYIESCIIISCIMFKVFSNVP